jgi:arabinogalactan endo-1,4-beta-galactosidase
MKKQLLILGFLAVLLLHFSCSGDDKNNEPIVAEDTFIRAADISYLPLIESENTVFYNNNQAENVITTLKNAGCNTIRIRLWKNPIDAHSGLAEVKILAQRVKQAGMKVWLTVHYSDTWADPGNQTTPTAWQNLSFDDLKSQVANYTATILTEINPDIFQIGNEINSGLLWPKGNLIDQESQCLELLATASDKIREQSPTTKIMIHYAGIDGGATWFFNKMSALDYDYIGLSYYPIWHGKSLVNLKNTIKTLGLAHNKKVIIAETSYPFTLDWNDWTNNIIGLENQLIPTYSPTPEGQKNYMLAIKTLLKETEYGQGFCYWGSEWVAFRGNESTNGSSFENQAMYDFNNNALPVMQVFNAN